MGDTNVFVNVDKTVVKITGLEVRGLNIQQLETILQEKLKTLTRIIGVTGDSIELDAYGIEEEEILRDDDGLIKAIALADGIKVSDITQLSQVKKIHQVDYDHIPPVSHGAIRLRLERNSGLSAACGTYSSEELPGTASSILASITACLAALRLVLETALCIKLLLTGGEHKFFSTLFAN